jgi:hypothetical protein
MDFTLFTPDLRWATVRSELNGKTRGGTAGTKKLSVPGATINGKSRPATQNTGRNGPSIRRVYRKTGVGPGSAAT